jgi:hypothetical protein
MIPQSRTIVQSSGDARAGLFGLGLMIVGLLALGMAGCGMTTTATTSDANGPQQSTQAPTHSGMQAPTQPPIGTQVHSAGTTTPYPQGGLGTRPCPGIIAGVNDAGTPNVVLTPQNAHQSASATVGDLVQVRLPATMHWSLQSTPAGLVVVQAGVQDPSLNMCAWTFRAVVPATATLNFTATAICERAVPCAQLALAMTFDVVIK